MPTSVIESDGASQAAFVSMWKRQLPYWHIAYAVLWATALAVAVFGGPPKNLALVLLLFGALAATYAGLAPRGFLVRDSWSAPLYHVISWSLLFTMMLLWPDIPDWAFFFALFPHVWAMFSRRVATVVSALVITVGVAVAWWTNGRPDQIRPFILSGVLSLGLALALGLFITQIVNEVQSRSKTLDDLRAAQSQLAAIERDRGIHNERERLAREIHDTLAQGFTSVLALSRAADAALARGDIATARDRLALVASTAADNLSEARLIVAETTPGHLQSRTLVEALARLVEAIGAESSVRARFVVEGAPTALGAAADVALLRAAQESLANVRRHSGASSVTVTLAYAASGPVTLTVADDGRGFDVAADSGGFGLDGIQARARELGGRAEVVSRPGGGTTVTMEIPAAVAATDGHVAAGSTKDSPVSMSTTDGHVSADPATPVAASAVTMTSEVAR